MGRTPCSGGVPARARHSRAHRHLDHPRNGRQPGHHAARGLAQDDQLVGGFVDLRHRGAGRVRSAFPGRFKSCLVSGTICAVSINCARFVAALRCYPCRIREFATPLVRFGEAVHFDRVTEALVPQFVVNDFHF